MESHSKEDPLIIPQFVTNPCSKFLNSHEEIVHFIGFISDLATQADEVARIAAKALYEVDDPAKYEEANERLKEKGALKILRSHRLLILQMMLCRAIENYLTYLSELVATIFKARPETLRSNETIRLDFALSHLTMEQLISEIVDRKVNELSYQGMRDLSKYLLDKLGFELFSDETQLERSVVIIEIRNIIVHNRGIVNKIFLSRILDKNVSLGQVYPLKVDFVFNEMHFLAKSVIDIDQRASEKFGLERPVCMKDNIKGGSEQLAAPDTSSGSR